MSTRAPSLLAALAALVLVAGACTDDEEGRIDVTDDESGPEETTADFGEPGTARLTYTARLTSLNDSGVTGAATLEASEESVTATVVTTGHSDTAAHAQHVHIGGENTCPGGADAGDGLITAAEGEEAYGSAVISLTTRGGVGADSRVDLALFPVASDGEIDYERTFELPPPVIAEDLDSAVVVVHGLPGLSGDPDVYDGDAESSLGADLPLEATIPIACGELRVGTAE